MCASKIAWLLKKGRLKSSEAARRVGQDDVARDLWTRALTGCPAVFRQLKLAAPVAIEHDGSPLAAALAERLAKSPRVRIDPDGFKVTLAGSGNRLTFKGRHFDGEAAVGEDVAAALTEAVNRFHQRFTSPQLDLTPAEINGLDSSSVARGEGGS